MTAEMSNAMLCRLRRSLTFRIIVGARWQRLAMSLASARLRVVRLDSLSTPSRTWWAWDGLGINGAMSTCPSECVRYVGTVPVSATDRPAAVRRHR